MQKTNPKKPLRPKQRQVIPGKENKMKPVPVFDNPMGRNYKWLIKRINDN